MSYAYSTFHLDWPDHWPDLYPPLWGSRLIGTYQPEHLDKLEKALHSGRMYNIHTFHLTCPFFPSSSLLNAIMHCPNIKDLRIVDTPLLTRLLPARPNAFKLERLVLVPVGEAIRVGEGPFNKKHHELTYYTCGYRKRHGGQNNLEFVGQQYLFQMGRSECLRYLQLSSKHMALRLDQLVSVIWAELETLVLTGPTPNTHWVPLADVVRHMPKLHDLRVLFSKTTTRTEGGFSVTGSSEDSPPDSLAKIKYLALSNAFETRDVLRQSPSLERLSICAVIAHPRIPIALSREEMMRTFQDLAQSGSNLTLKFIRLMTEEVLDFDLFQELGAVCPALEHVEVELCGYREGEAGFEWVCPFPCWCILVWI